MKKHKVIFATIILIACLAIVSVALSGSLPGSAPSRIVSTTTPATTGARSAQPQVAQRRQRPANFLASPLDLNRLTKQADLIVIARVSSIDNQHGTIASLAVDKVVKGEASGTVNVEFQPDAPTAFVSIEQSSFGMFFLSRNANGSYGFAERTYPYLPARVDTTVADEPPLDRVVNVMGQLLLKPGSIHDRRLAAHILRSAQGEQATQLLRQGAKDKDSVVKTHSISALLDRDDIGALEMAESILLHPPANTEQYLLDNVAAALYGIKSPRAIPVLQRLLRATEASTRVNAVAALRHMRAQEAVEALVIALDDNNRDVRYEAVMGLAELSSDPGPLLPAQDTFAENEQHYLNHWKEWARNR